MYVTHSGSAAMAIAAEIRKFFETSYASHEDTIYKNLAKLIEDYLHAEFQIAESTNQDFRKAKNSIRVHFNKDLEKSQLSHSEEKVTNRVNEIIASAFDKVFKQHSRKNDLINLRQKTFNAIHGEEILPNVLESLITDYAVDSNNIAMLDFARFHINQLGKEKTKLFSHVTLDQIHFETETDTVTLSQSAPPDKQSNSEQVVKYSVSLADFKKFAETAQKQVPPEMQPLLRYDEITPKDIEKLTALKNSDAEKASVVIDIIHKMHLLGLSTRKRINLILDNKNNIDWMNCCINALYDAKMTHRDIDPASLDKLLYPSLESVLLNKQQQIDKAQNFADLVAVLKNRGQLTQKNVDYLCYLGPFVIIENPTLSKELAHAPASKFAQHMENKITQLTEKHIENDLRTIAEALNTFDKHDAYSLIPSLRGDALSLRESYEHIDIKHFFHDISRLEYDKTDKQLEYVINLIKNYMFDFEFRLSHIKRWQQDSSLAADRDRYENIYKCIYNLRDCVHKIANHCEALYKAKPHDQVDRLIDAILGLHEKTQKHKNATTFHTLFGKSVSRKNDMMDTLKEYKNNKTPENLQKVAEATDKFSNQKTTNQELVEYFKNLGELCKERMASTLNAQEEKSQTPRPGTSQTRGQA